MPKLPYQTNSLKKSVDIFLVVPIMANNFCFFLREKILSQAYFDRKELFLDNFEHKPFSSSKSPGHKVFVKKVTSQSYGLHQGSLITVVLLVVKILASFYKVQSSAESLST